MNTICFTDREASLFTKQNGITILRPLREQPPKGYEFVRTHEGYAVFINNNRKEFADIPISYPSRVYGVKETWEYYYCHPVDSQTGEDLGVEEGFYYKADGGSAQDRWYSPVTMPTEAIRWTIKVDTTVKRVQELTVKEIQLVGINKMYLDDLGQTWSTYKRGLQSHWNSLHARPVKKGDGYVCYPYDMDSFRKLMYGLEREYVWNGHPIIQDNDDKLFYKGKPLVIHDNPYFQVLSCEKTEGVNHGNNS